jgi:transposase-like protein
MNNETDECQEVRPSTAQQRTKCETALKIQIVEQILRGKSLDTVARETGRSKKQLSFWYRRFLTGGEAYLASREDLSQISRLQELNRALRTKAEDLEKRNRELVQALEASRTGALPRSLKHPKCSEHYAKAFEATGVDVFQVPEWRTHVLLKTAPSLQLVQHATGVSGHSSLDPDCDLKGGLERLRRAGVGSVSLITDPMWSPGQNLLEAAFGSCRPFNENYLIDRGLGRVRVQKRHRNMINDAKRLCHIDRLHLAPMLERWWNLYQSNQQMRAPVHSTPPKYFEMLAGLEGVDVIAAHYENEIVTMNIWLRFNDILYYIDGASNQKGLAISAPYATFAYVIEHYANCRYIFLGGSADFRGPRSDGLARFKRGFANVSVRDYLCTSHLRSRS